MVTIKDIASEAHVSVGSVSRYLNGYQLKATNAEKIKAAIEKLNYIPNQAAKALKMNKSFSVGVLVDNMDNFYSSQLIARLEQLFDQADYFLLLTSHRNSEQIFKYKLQKLIERSVDALIVLKAETEWDSFQKMGKLNVPVISVEASLLDQSVPEVLSADQLAAKEVVERMVHKRQKTAFIIPTESDYVLQQRLAGINAAYKSLAKSLNPENVYYVDYGTAGAYELVPKLIQRGFDSIFVTNYTNAIQVVQGVRDARKIVGKDIAVAGFGYSNLLQNMRLPVTLIKQPVNKVAEIVSETVLNLLKGQKVEHKALVQDEIFWQKELKND
ncbi:LacI family DNA-binding transcriptional regulator [Lactobacillus sp. ESL0677]|uniref:LacI family DNA-binding transcriptional regulator n=1 Tax=Lactobacillus sp. ESL0677 TaxID=2983208 RepID=UPI0023F86501|nr:LacI family DNA-binding transcriptional regulator [Lactobacillus sp. ESL0677]WEV36504.1 LacI family DNA-binding transcriptional regulator [Lactobacillus sp. ESL0677]